MSTTIRAAVPADAPGLVVLRTAMFAAMGDDVGREDAPWRGAARSWFASALARDREAVAVVAEADGGELVACAMAVLHHRAPSPSDPGGRYAHVSQVSTLPDHRRRGHARACLEALLALLDERGVRRSDLHATGDGAHLYTSLGFRPAPYPSLRRTAP